MMRLVINKGIKMSEHGMMTRLKKQQIESRKVLLTEDLLYIVNKKLRLTDKARRDKIVQSVQENDRPFTKIVTRDSPLNFTETELAVMHKVKFNSQYTAVCEISSMERLRRNVRKAAASTNSRDYMCLLGSKSAPYYGVYATNKQLNVNSVARVVQLPKDYFRPNSDCHFFGELAWKEDGVMMVEAEKFALCMNIWRLKEWLVLSDYNRYPLHCKPIEGQCTCRCNALLHAMWTDMKLRKFFLDQGVEVLTADNIDYDTYFSTYKNRNRQNYREGLRRARIQMQLYCKRLITGEEMICRSTRSINVLASLQLQRILERLRLTIECIHFK